MPKELAIYKVKDGAENYYTHKDIIFDLPFRVLIIGKSQLSGKSNLILNLMLRPEYYGSDFKGENIYIVSPSVHNDDKLKKFIEVKDIPQENIMTEYDEEVLKELYKMIQQDYEEAVGENKKPENTLVIFDDISFNGDLKSKKGGIINKMFMNGRHILLSTLITAQKYSDISTGARENATGLMVFDCSNKQLELIETDHNCLDSKKDFYKLFRNITGVKHDFFVINYTNPKEHRYQDQEFNYLKY
jgi:hypothetical protein